MDGTTNDQAPRLGALRTRWAAVGAAVAITLGGGGLGIVQATTSSGERPIYKPINPCRLADVRPAPNTVGPRTSPLGPNEVYTLSGHGAVGDCVLPTDITGLALNVTAVGPSASTFIRLWPADEDQPTTSNLNPTPGSPPTPNAVNVGLSAAGQFSVFNRFGSVAIIIDVVGVYDDHNHDDAYYSKAQVYSKAEVDALLAANKVKILGASGNSATDLTTTDTVYRTLTIVAPSNGLVLANSSSYIRQADANRLVARCAITTATSMNNPDATSHYQYVDINSGTSSSEVMSGTRTFAAAAGQSLTVNLLCDEFTGQGVLEDPSLNLTFVPS